MSVTFDPIGHRNAGAQWADRLTQTFGNARAGRQLSQGDTREAANTLYRFGDLSGGQALTQQADQSEAAKRAKEIEVTLQVTRALKDVRDQGGDVLAALESYRPALAQLGVDESTYGQVRGFFANNPQGIEQLEQLAGRAQRELNFQKTGDNLLVFEEGNPDPIRQFAAPRQPINVGGVLVDPNSYEPLIDTREPKTVTVQNSDGSSSIVQIDQPAPASFGGGGAAPAAVDGVALIQEIIPGVSFNSGTRTPEQNRTAGGSPRSFHLQGQAVDIPPQQGRTPAQLRRELEARGLQVEELIDEGDHWHIAWRNGGRAPNFGRGEAPRSGGVRTVAAGENRGPTPAQAMAQERADRAENTADIRAQSALRREFNNRQEVKDFRTVQSAYNSVQAAAANPSAAGDLSLIFAYMKILDPGSVVREQEFANAQNAAGIPDRVRNLYNRALNGERLSERQRADFISQANNLFRTRQNTYGQVAQEYASEAELQGFEPSRIVGGGQQQQAPRLRFEPSAAQNEWYRQNGNPQARAAAGSRTNPRFINPRDPTSSYANVPSGQYFVTPDGQLRQKR